MKKQVKIVEDIGKGIIKEDLAKEKKEKDKNENESDSKLSGRKDN